MKYIYYLAIFIMLAGGAYFVLQTPDSGDFVVRPELLGENTSESSKDNGAQSAQTGRSSDYKKDVEVSGTEKNQPNTILFDVPFTSQAPFGNWDNIVYQQACEESSVLMAMMWAQRKRGLSPQDANDSIQILASFEQKTYGEFRDTSADDTARFLRDYFNYDNVEVLSNINTDDIINKLEDGNLVIVPVHGQKLANPFFSPPGPVQHMLLVRGYDYTTREFITNDPGTRHGNGYRYTKSVLENALQDYPTGYKEPIIKINKKMIVISRG